MKLLLKSAAMLLLIAGILFPLGFYDGVSQAKDKSEARLEEYLPFMVAFDEGRTRRNIKKLETLGSGITIYSYQFINDNTTYVGLLASDLVKHKLFKAYVVYMGEGSYMINYEKLGFQMVTMETFEKHGIKALKTSTEMASKKHQ